MQPPFRERADPRIGPGVFAPVTSNHKNLTNRYQENKCNQGVLLVRNAQTRRFSPTVLALRAWSGLIR